MEIRMYDVNFGDCILYTCDSKQLLVDCGAKFSRTGCSAYSRVRHAIGTDICLMITHFDVDHYNGVLCMPDTQKFNKIFLPLYIWRGNKQQSTARVFIDEIKSQAYLFIMGLSCKT